MKKMKLGIMLSEIPHSNLAIIIKNEGFNFLIIDCEHGGFDYSSVASIVMTCKLINLKVIVRLSDNCRKDIIKYMDMGANGLLLPMTNTLDDIKKVVEYAYYPPMGKRGISTMRQHTMYNPGKIEEYICNANKVTEIYAQIETQMGLDNLNEIFALKGVTGCLVGPNDLSCDLNCFGDADKTAIMEAIKRVSKYAKQHGKISGIITGNKFLLNVAMENDMTMFSVGSELSILKKAAKDIIQEF